MHSLTDPADAFLIGVGIHPKCGTAVRMSKSGSHADDIRTVRDCKAGRRVTQFVRMKMFYPVPLPELPEILCGRVRVHRFRAVVLREHPAHRHGLRPAHYPKQLYNIRRNVHNTDFAVLGQSLVHSTVFGILQVSLDGDGSSVQIYRLPLQTAGLSPAAPGVNQQENKRLPLQRLIFQTAKNIPYFLGGERLVFRWECCIF